MNEETASTLPRERLRGELEATRRAYHELLAEIPDAAWDRPTANAAWTVRQMMFHITLALRFLPADVALMRRGRMPAVPPWLFNALNEWYTRFMGKRQTRASLAAEYDKRHAAVVSLLETIEPEEWALTGEYPDINRNLEGTRSMADMFHYISVHFDEHAADIRPALERGDHEQKKQQAARPPQGIARLLYRAPLMVYRLRLGWLLGGRFLRLTHTGRKSGLPRQAVLEVIEHEAETDTFYVVSGFGRQSQWFKNVKADPEVTIQVGPRLLEARAEVLDEQASGNKLVDYARRHPFAAQALTRALGYELDGSEEQLRHLGADHMPVVALRTRRVLRQTPDATQLAALALVLVALLLPLLLRFARCRRRTTDGRRRTAVRNH